MQTTFSPGAAVSVNDQVLRALQLNKNHQAEVKTQIEQLENKLASLDKLLVTTEECEDDFESEAGGYISIPGSSAVSAPITCKELASEDSPFYADSQRRQRYLDFIGYHPMKAKELEDLAEAVKTENHRLYALQQQRSGNPALVQNPPEDFLQFNTEGIDWGRVASTMASRGGGRTARECEIKWMGDRYPSINHTQWSQSEISKCKDLIDAYRKKYGHGQAVDWVWVVNELKTNRTPLDCMRHGAVRKTHVWTPEADNTLMEAVKTYGLNNWLLVARVVSPDATGQQCQNRYQRTLDPTLKRGPWSSTEDAKLHLAVTAYGNSWVDVAAIMDGRSNEQCRDRWNERLDPTINREAWTEEEDKLLMDTISELGEGKWKAVSERMGNGRKDSACRARYETLKKCKAKGTVSMNETGFSNSLYGRANQPDETPEAARHIPRKRVSAKGKGKEAVIPYPEGDLTQVGGGPAPRRPRGRPPKVVIQDHEEIPSTPEDAGTNIGRPKRPVPRKRARSSPSGSLPTTGRPGLGEKQDA